MTLTTINIILWVCIALNLWCAWKNYKNLSESHNQTRKAIAIAKKYDKLLENVADALESDGATYCAEMHDNIVEVWRETNLHNMLVCVLIKRFSDEDMEYNQREAQELCDKLNAK